MDITVTMAMKRIQNILNVEDEHLTLLTELATIQSEILAEKLGAGTVPANLLFIVVETTISRYRKVGAEGMTDKNVDVIRNKYSENLFEPYEDIIADYARKSGATTGKKIVRVI